MWLRISRNRRLETIRALPRVSRYIRQMIRILAFACSALLIATPVLAAQEGALRIAVERLSAWRGDPYQDDTLPAVLTRQAIYDTLTMVGDKGEVLPSLAEKWKAEDAKTWIFTLRQGVSFSNGEPFTAEALAVSAEYLATPEGRTTTLGIALRQVDRVEAVDELTARVILNAPDPLFPLHASVWRIPAPVAFKNLGIDGLVDNPIGTGPFVVTSWAEESASLAANPSSWRAPKVSDLVVRTVPGRQARLQALVSGEVDMALDLPVNQEPLLRPVGAHMAQRLMPAVVFLAADINRRNSELKDRRVRMAMNLAVDRFGIIDRRLGKATDPSAQLAFPGAFGYDPKITLYSFDPAQARQLLTAAGYADGLTLTLKADPETIADGVDIYQAIISDLHDVGISVELLAQSSPDQDARIDESEADLMTKFARGFDSLTDVALGVCNTERRGCNAKIVQAFQAALAETKVAHRELLYKRAAALERDNPPGIPLWQAVEFDGVARGVSGYEPVFDDLRLYLIEKRSAH